ncbi:MAG: hypothetical protein ACP5E3_01740 [Bacteroidales bacterium]
MKAKKIIAIAFILLWIIAPPIKSQTQIDEGDILQNLKGSGQYNPNIEIQVDSLLEDNYYKHILYNQKHPGIMGYRIRIFSGSGHDAFEKANETRARFLSRYENIDADITYDAPDYKVYIGDCRTRSEVLELFERIKSDFPYAFLVERPINVDYEKLKQRPDDR